MTPRPQLTESVPGSGILRKRLVGRRLSRLQAHVFQDLDSVCSLDDAARIVGLERKYFSAFFRAKVGVRFSCWLRLVRIQAASELIQARNLSIAEVAYSVGFKDLRTFQRAFKRVMGMTPFCYRSASNTARNFSTTTSSAPRDHDKCRDGQESPTYGNGDVASVPSLPS